MNTKTIILCALAAFYVAPAVAAPSSMHEGGGMRPGGGRRSSHNKAPVKPSKPSQGFLADFRKDLEVDITSDVQNKKADIEQEESVLGKLEEKPK